ncbi:MAG: neutral/alkaline non-lysosomal ceramidase N-terminal domain-containing protein [Thermogutta sp.]
MKHAWLLLAVLFCVPVSAQEFEVGVGRVKITPEKPIRMSGYAARNKPSVGVLQDLWAKALAIRDKDGHRIVIVTTDLIGFSRDFSDDLFRRAKERFALNREEILLTCSHTHSGPVVGNNLRTMYRLTDEEAATIEEYTNQLSEKLLAAIDGALQSMQPAHLKIGHGKADFAINRRENRGENVVIGVNPQGPTDHDVPVITVSGPDGKLRAILFGYACHNTTIGGTTGDDFYKIHGDYAGVAQAELESRHPGVTAMFTILCGGDQNPNPRGTLDYVFQHGKSLADAVEQTLQGPMREVKPAIRAAVLYADLPFAPHTRQMFEEELTKAVAAKDFYRESRARRMLELYDQGQPMRTVAVPLQAIRFDNSLTFLAIGGETCVEYALRCKREFPQEELVVIGYANDVMCYIPSKNVLRGGGYEPVSSMIYYGMPGPFAENVEEVIMTAVYKVLASVGLQPAGPETATN